MKLQNGRQTQHRSPGLSEAKSGDGVDDRESAPDFASLNPGYTLVPFQRKPL
jgi:hypothetical protein